MNKTFLTLPMAVGALFALTIVGCSDSYDFAAERQRFETIVADIRTHGETHSQATGAERDAVIAELRAMQAECREIAAEFNVKAQSEGSVEAPLDASRCQK